MKHHFYACVYKRMDREAGNDHKHTSCTLVGWIHRFVGGGHCQYNVFKALRFSRPAPERRARFALQTREILQSFRRKMIPFLWFLFQCDAILWVLFFCYHLSTLMRSTTSGSGWAAKPLSYTLTFKGTQRERPVSKCPPSPIFRHSLWTGLSIIDDFVGQEDHRGSVLNPERPNEGSVQGVFFLLVQLPLKWNNPRRLHTVHI